MYYFSPLPVFSDELRIMLPYISSYLHPFSENLWEHWHQFQTFCLRKSEHQVHILYCLSCRTFYQVVNGSHHDDTVGSWIDLEIDVYIITSFYPFCLRAYILFQNTDEFLIFIIFILDCFDFFVGHIFFQCCIFRRQNSSVHRNQMWREVDQHFLS